MNRYDAGKHQYHGHMKAHQKLSNYICRVTLLIETEADKLVPHLPQPANNLAVTPVNGWVL